MDVVPLEDLVVFRQGASREDPVAAKKLNALNSRSKSTNYRVCWPSAICQASLTACSGFLPVLMLAHCSPLHSY